MRGIQYAYRFNHCCLWNTGSSAFADDDDSEAKPIDDTLLSITARYGTRPTDFVAMQLEYPTR
jgi:hypothetical protein